jgi:hypothetical protein
MESGACLQVKPAKSSPKFSTARREFDCGGVGRPVPADTTRWTLKPGERQAQVLAQSHALQAERTVEELAKSFGIPSLINRRDLEQLEAGRLILHRWGDSLDRERFEKRAAAGAQQSLAAE